MSSRTVWTRVGLGAGMAALAAVTATGAFGGASASATSAAAAKPTLAVVVVGSGRVTSAPAGISCPGKCAAAFAAGSRVRPHPDAEERFPVPPLGWRLRRRPAHAGSGSQAWPPSRRSSSGRRQSRHPTPTSAVVPGGYSGQNSQNGNGVAFSVPAGGGSVLNFSLPRVNLVCVGGGGFSDSHLGSRRRRSSPTARSPRRARRDGVVERRRGQSSPTSVSGRFQGKSATGAATATGVFRADIAFADAPNA